MAEDKMQTDAAAPAAANGTAAQPVVPKAKTPAEVLRAITVLLENAVKLKETRLMSGRVMRMTAAARKQLTGEVLRNFINTTLAAEVESKAYLLSAVDQVGGVVIKSIQQLATDSYMYCNGV